MKGMRRESYFPNKELCDFLNQGSISVYYVYREERYDFYRSGSAKRQG